MEGPILWFDEIMSLKKGGVWGKTVFAYFCINCGILLFLNSSLDMDLWIFN